MISQKHSRKHTHNASERQWLVTMDSMFTSIHTQQTITAMQQNHPHHYLNFHWHRCEEVYSNTRINPQKGLLKSQPERPLSSLKAQRTLWQLSTSSHIRSMLRPMEYSSATTVFSLSSLSCILCSLIWVFLKIESSNLHDL